MGGRKKFNITGLCIPKKHYMVDMDAKLEQIIEQYIENEEYFTVNRARQYGKTTLLELLYQRLKKDYIILDISFEGKEDYFRTLDTLADGLCYEFQKVLKRSGYPELARIFEDPGNDKLPIQCLGERITILCGQAKKKVILMVDEVDKAADHQIFLTFLGLLRDKYMMYQRGREETFSSVILAGVHDIKNLKVKIRPEGSGRERQDRVEHTNYNSPWNISADFVVDLGFSPQEIEAMLWQYENDCHTGMDISKMSELLYTYTEGYPFLVSCLCKHMDETPYPWTSEGLQSAVSFLLGRPNTLFDDIIKNLERYQGFKNMVEGILLRGADVSYIASNPDIARGEMYGILKNENGHVKIANPIFESYIYEYFVSLHNITNLVMSKYSDKSIYIKDGKLDIETVLQRFSAFMKEEYRNEDSGFIEQQGRLLFLSFLRPIINGTGHYAVEVETRCNTRMDLVVFYGAQKFIIEIKIWRGEKYEEDGYEQLAGYLRAQNAQRGYLLSFCDNKKSPREGRLLQFKGCEIYEVVVAYRDFAAV